MHTSLFTFYQSVNLISPVLRKVFRLNIISSFFFFLPLRASLRAPKIAVFPRTRRQRLLLECDSDVGDETLKLQSVSWENMTLTGIHLYSLWQSAGLRRRRRESVLNAAKSCPTSVHDEWAKWVYRPDFVPFELNLAFIKGGTSLDYFNKVGFQ